MTFHDMEHESVRGSQISFFLTSTGYSRLEQIDSDRADQRRKTREFLLTIMVAVLAAIVGGWASTYFQGLSAEF